VTIDGRPANIGERVDPDAAVVAVDGRQIGRAAGLIYLVLHKPPGVTSTVRDPHAQRTVLDLVPPGLRPAGTRLYPVGRLDRDSEGLILLTNDGDWADGILHPRHGLEREYALGTRDSLVREQVETLEAGIPLDEGLATLTHFRRQTPIETRRLETLVRPTPPALVWYRATLEQGWKRQLRRMFAAVGMPVQRLVRVRVGTIRLEDLGSGVVRALDPREVRSLGARPGQDRT
jgi:23S rRNA pseudouridine2605 synthase